MQVLWYDDPKSLSGDLAALSAALPRGAEVKRVDSLTQLGDAMQARTPNALVLCLAAGRGDAVLSQAPWSQWLADVPVVLVTDEVDNGFTAKWIAAGAQDIMTPMEASGAAFARRVAYAMARKGLERDARKSWSTDLNTGLVNRVQLLEHLSQLTALRARQPGPMAVLAIRATGVAPIEAAHGAAVAQLVRRKLAVRLRGAVRASDVVAALSPDLYAVLLTWLEAAPDAEAVARKLSRGLSQAFTVSGLSVAVQAHVGIAHFPDNGREAEALLGHALTQAELLARQPVAAANDA